MQKKKSVVAIKIDELREKRSQQIAPSKFEEKKTVMSEPISENSKKEDELVEKQFDQFAKNTNALVIFFWLIIASLSIVVLAIAGALVSLIIKGITLLF